MRTWWQLLRQREWLSAERLRGRRRAAKFHIISDRALRLAAEILEPRCLMTDATGLAADDGSGDILVDASQWDDAGLTLLRDGDLAHLVRTGTTQDVIAPFAADAPGSLVIQGRDNARDVLTIDLSGSTYVSGDNNAQMLLTKGLHFDGGQGRGTDELRFANPPSGWFLDEFVFRISAINNESYIGLDGFNWNVWNGGGFFSASFKQVELVTEPFSVYSEISFGAEEAITDEVITVDQNRPNGMALIADKTLGVSIQLPVSNDVGVHSGRGNDRITILSSPKDGRSGLYVDGGEGNDTLIGSSGNDRLNGSWGDDSIDGGAGDDSLSGDLGNDTIRGGSGHDTLYESPYPQWWLNDYEQVAYFTLATHSMSGLGQDVLDSIEQADLWFAGSSNPIKVDASGFNGPVAMLGSGVDDTLIGGPQNDTLNGDGGNDLLIGGKGDDLLIYPDGWSSWFDYAGHDTLSGGPGNDTYQINGDLQPVIIDDEKELKAYLAKSSAVIATVVTTSEQDTVPLAVPAPMTTAPDDKATNTIQNEGDFVPSQTQTFLVPSPANMLLGQGLNEPSDEDATLPETLVTDAESDGEDSGLSDSANPDLARDAGDDSTPTDSVNVSLEDMLANPLLVNDLLASETAAST